MITVGSMKEAGFIISRLGGDYIQEKGVYLNTFEFRCPCGADEIISDYGDRPWTMDEALDATAKSSALSAKHLIDDGYPAEDVERIRKVLGVI